MSTQKLVLVTETGFIQTRASKACWNAGSTLPKPDKTG